MSDRHTRLTNVVLGPALDLHPGVHGTLLESPPPGFAYTRAAAQHVFLFSRGSGYPNVYETPHWGELVSFAARAPLVHTARWPALNARAWVADMDDFGYPILIGRALLSPEVRRSLVSAGRSGGLPAAHPVLRRLAHMLRAYAHPSCRAVLFRTRRALNEAVQTIVDLEAGADGETFLEKCQVLGPGLPPMPAAELEQKWQERAGLNVLFCGDDWRIKNGALALRVMAKLATKYRSARFMYVGSPPPDWSRGLARALPTNLRVLGRAPREHVQTLFTGAHILFHPSRSESFGMVLLEAAAAGLAIVCARGRGMEHVSEIVEPAGAALLDRDVVPERDEESHFLSLLDALLAHRPRARAMALSNHQHIEGSALSAVHRNAELQRVYSRALETRALRGLCEEDLQSDRALELRRLDPQQLIEAEREFRRRSGVDCQSIAFPLAWKRSAESTAQAWSSSE